MKKKKKKPGSVKIGIFVPIITGEITSIPDIPGGENEFFF